MIEWVVKYWTQWLFSIVAAFLTWAYTSLAQKLKKEHDEQKAIKAGLQALLRAQMISDYNHYREKGYAPIYAREAFENCWIQYERLGTNGVIKEIRTKFMELPTNDPRDTKDVKET